MQGDPGGLALCRADELEAQRNSLQTRLAAAESRIHEMEDQQEQYARGSDGVGWEGRCRAAEHRVKELEAAVLDVMTNRRPRGSAMEDHEALMVVVADLATKVQALEGVLEVATSRAALNVQMLLRHFVHAVDTNTHAYAVRGGRAPDG